MNSAVRMVAPSTHLLIGQPGQTHDRALITFLTEFEVEALLTAPDQETRTVRRGHVLSMVAIHCGLHGSELIAPNRGAVHLGRGAHVICTDSGREQGITPPATNTFPNLSNGSQNDQGKPPIRTLPAAEVSNTDSPSPSRPLEQPVRNLHGKQVTIVSLRHAAAMQLLQAVDTTLTPLWLGRESVEVMQTYLHDDLEGKELAMARATPRHPTWTLSPTRGDSRRAAGPLIMPTSPRANPSTAKRFRLDADKSEVGIWTLAWLPGHAGHGRIDGVHQVAAVGGRSPAGPA